MLHCPPPPQLLTPLYSVALVIPRVMPSLSLLPVFSNISHHMQNPSHLSDHHHAQNGASTPPPPPPLPTFTINHHLQNSSPSQPTSLPPDIHHHINPIFKLPPRIKRSYNLSHHCTFISTNFATILAIKKLKEIAKF